MITVGFRKGVATLTNMILPRLLMQRNVLADQDADPDSAEVEPIQELVDLGELIQAHLRTV